MQTQVQVKERPILFSGPMVRALLAGTKTQTRRVAKHPLAQEAVRILSYHGQSEFDCVLDDETGGIILCPYGKPGDRLWVRETWQALSFSTDFESGLCDDYGPIKAADVVAHRASPYYNAFSKAQPCDFVYKADGHFDELHKEDRGFAWSPSLFMPRAASRLLLEIVSVRVERVQSISEEDAIAEGVNLVEDDIFYEDYRDDCRMVAGAQTSYMTLWESINGADSWAANPWVWVVEFKRVEPC